MMTKKDYEAAAAIIARSYDRAEQRTDYDERNHARAEVIRLEFQFANYFESENPQFSRNRFCQVINANRTLLSSEDGRV